jgi:long-chain-fatty-acid--CoA ligase ACSBG
MFGPSAVETNEKVDRRIAKQKPDQVCSLIYTSGTTGMPKAAALTHDNLTYVARSAGDVFSLDHTHHGLSYLPLSHIAAQQLDCIAPLTHGYGVDIAPNDALKGTNLKQHIVNTRPSYFLAVPRVWEKFKEVIESKLSSASQFRKILFGVSTYIGLRSVQHLQYIEAKEPSEIGYLDELTTEVSKIALWTFDTLLFSRVKEALGLDICKIAASGAGVLDPKVTDFFAGLNIRIINIYGMSESSGFITYEGKPLPGTEITTGKEGEIFVKGRHVFKEYWNNPEATKETVDDQGFLRTGDLGKLNDQGSLAITGRLKELIKTSGGENIPPIRIEQRLQQELPMISQALVVGDGKNFLTCLFTLKTELDSSGSPTNKLNQEVLELLQKIGSNATTVEGAANDQALHTYMEEGLARANKQADSQAQRVAKFKILPEDFTVANGLMTATLKVRRSEVTKRYVGLIEQMYA